MGRQKLFSGSAKTAVHLEKLFFCKGFEALKTFRPGTEAAPEWTTGWLPAKAAAGSQLACTPLLQNEYL